MQPGMTVEQARAEALAYPCDYRVPVQVRTRRGLRDGGEKLCGAAPGEPCRDPRTGHQLLRQAAHLPRLRSAGVAAAPRLSDAYGVGAA